MCDNAEQTRSEQALRDSSRLSQEILDALKEHICVLDEQGRILAVNKAWRDFAAANPPLPDKIDIGADYFAVCDAVTGDDAVRAREAVRGLRAVIRGEIPEFSFEYPCHSPDTQRWFLMRVTPLSDEGRSGIVVAHNSITERKRAEEALRESEERYRAFFENSLDAMLLTIPDGRILAANPAACRMFGRTEEEICRIGRAGLVDPCDSRVEEAVAIRLRTGCALAEFTMLRGDGTKFLVEASSSVFRAVDGSSRTSIIIRDITEQKRMDAALRASEAKYRIVADNTYDWEFWRTPDGQFPYISPSCERVSGHTADEFMADPDLLLRILHPDDRDRFGDNFWSAPDHGKAEIEFRNLRPDGAVRWIGHACQSVFDEAGQFLGHRGSNRDITERKQGELALRESEDRYRTVVEDQTEVICRFRTDGTFTYVNDVYCRLFGKTQQELLGRKWQSRAVPDDLRMIEEKLRTLSPANPIVLIENRIHSGSGQVRWMQFINRGFFDRDGQLLEMQSVGRDITERKLADETLERTSAELKAVYEHAPVMMCVVDRDRRILYANREFTEFTGVPEADLQAGHACGIFGCVNAQTDSRGCGFGSNCTDCSLRLAIEDTWNTGLGHWNVERRLTLERAGIRQDVVLLGATALIQTIGQTRLLLCLQDITERKRGEEALRDLSRRQLKIQEEERRLLARELHDEIGQILTGLKLTLEMATGRNSDSSQEALGESQELVGELIRQVRELSLNLRPPILDDLGLLPALLWQFERFTARTKIRVDFEHAGLEGRPCSPDVETAAYRIVQEALTNIVRHAEVSTTLVRIRVEQGRLALRVEDHGRGFEPTIAMVPGASSGLEGMHERARLLGGRLRIESSSGAGTRVLADLPLG